MHCAGCVSSVEKAINAAQRSHLGRKQVAKLSQMAPSLEESAASAKSPAETTRMRALAEILMHPQA